MCGTLSHVDPLYLYEYLCEEKQPAPEKQECDCFDVETQDLLAEWRHYCVDS